MTPSTINKAEIDRNGKIINIARLERKVDNHGTHPVSPPAADTYIENAKKIKNELEEIYNRILHLAPPDMKPHETEHLDLIERLDNVIISLHEIKIAAATAASASTSRSSSSTAPPPGPTMTMKLPEMKLPTFDGKFEDWPSFEDLFKATIHKNKSLSAAQKLQYLKSCVNGEASNLIKSFTITDNNYTEAWTLLASRYNNSREIISSLVKKIIFQQQIKHEDSAQLQILLNTTQECVRSLQVMGRPTDKWDDLLVVILVDKMDSETRSEWAKSLQGTAVPTFQEISDFLERHIRSLIARGNLTTKVSNPTPHKFPRQVRSHHGSSSSSPSTQCSLCNGPHPLYRCNQFIKMQPQARVQAIKRVSACFNCLRDGHSTNGCSSKHTCKVCSRKHHTMLHIPTNSSGNNTGGSGLQDAPAPPQHISSNTASSLVNPGSTQVLLKTAMVLVPDVYGNKQQCRVLLDDGSEASFMSESCASALGLQRSRTDIQITGISASTAAQVKWKVTARLHSSVHDAFVDIEALLLPKVTGTLPRVPVDSSRWSHLHNLELADPTYYKPGDIDILLGADVVASIMREGIRNGPSNAPIAQNSIFGWVLSGRVSISHQTIIRSNHVMCRLESLVQRFWEVEDVPNRKPITPEEAACEAYFKSTAQRLPNGKYMLRLPFKPNVSVNNIGDTRALAERRLLQLEKRFIRNPTHYQDYKSFIDEYVNLGHMELVTTPAENAVYIPHHYVVKEDSTTTKLRVVFDASMKSSSGVSLNDALMIGPTVQDDLFSLLIRFRLHPVALKADIAKMYRQFEIHPDDRDFLRILWRDNPSTPIQEFRLKTVTYGTAPAPFLATRCLQQLADDERERFPKAASVLEKDMYVDDLMGGESSTDKAVTLTKDLISIVSAGGMCIRKWCSNDEAVLASIPEELRETGSSHMFDDEASVKALGISWQPKQDVFTFYSKTRSNTLTKRDLLSEIAKTFDPLGWLSPLTINAKILFQDLWQCKVDWDDVIDVQFQARWKAYQAQLEQLSNLLIPRCIMPSNSTSYEVHGFSDASEKAYAACIYLKCISSDGRTTINLIAARSKVAPTRQMSLPRLELCGAVLLTELVESVMQASNLKCPVCCYSDSMIVIKWIASPSRRWKTFVANRVAAIQEVVPAEQWRHVAGVDNPADLPSRGISVEELISSNMWWNGPSWLATSSIPVSAEQLNMKQVQEEEKPKAVLAHHASTTPSFIMSYVTKFSTLRKLISTTCVLLSFIKFLKTKTNPGAIFPINPLMRKEIMHRIIKQTQVEAFSEDINKLRSSREVSNNVLSKLVPYLDEEGLIRVGGRLNNAAISHDRRHPIILPRHNHLVTLLIEDTHIRNFHGGLSLTLASLLHNYWIIGARDTVRHIIRKCMRCRKITATTMQQQMGQLPSARVTAHRPFLHSGVDFAGPFNVKMRRGRGSVCDKVYFCIFVCFSTKAVHLEAVTSLSTDAFIACFRRFIARRGICSHLYSDCGTNFVGAERELRRMIIKIEDKIQQQVSQIGTTFHFNPPAAPHQGGLWEAGVKSVKYHMKRVIGNSNLTLEQFETLLCNVEACLNSRPLCAISSDPTDFSVLTPGHFLIGCPLTAVPEPDLTMTTKPHHDYWKEVQRFSQHIWTRWHNEYLSSLQQRYKWTKKHPNLNLGDLVIIKDDNQPPTKWKTGRVIQVFPGSDGLVRKATLRTVIDSSTTPVKFNELTRPIQKLSPLLISNEMH